MNHYETLGVPRNATAGEIKSAFRRKSSEAHPDRNGGDTVRQQAVNGAYATLRDPAKRKHYDETGEDPKAVPEKPTLEQLAATMLVKCMVRVLTQPGNIIDVLHQHMAEVRNGALAHISKLEDEMEILTARRDKISVTEGKDNLIHMAIDSQLGGMRSELKTYQDNLPVLAAAAKLLHDYHSSERADKQEISIMLSILG